jgi:hypothetical protein
MLLIFSPHISAAVAATAAAAAGGGARWRSAVQEDMSVS